MDIDFSPEKSLFSLRVVHWCAGLSAAIAISISLAIAYSLRYYPLELTGEGFNHFADLYKVPATFLAIGFTLVGLCAANHRSEQTKRQIERTSRQLELVNIQMDLTKSQNNFSNYYKHIEEFEKYCRAIKDFEFYITHPRMTYRAIFSDANSKSEKISVSKKSLESLDYLIEQVIYLSDAFQEESNDFRRKNAFLINEKIELFKSASSVQVPISGDGISVNSIFGDFILTQGSWQLFFENFVKLVEITDILMKFDLEYNSSENIKKCMKIKIDLIPGKGRVDDKFSIF